MDKHEDFIGLENVKDLYSTLDYKPVLIRAGFNNNYLEYGSDGNNSLSFMEYLNLIKPYLEDLINDKKNKGEWKLQLTAQISFVSLKPGSDETRLMHTRSVTMEFMSGRETEEIIESLYRSLLQNYYDNLQKRMRSSDFVFNGNNYFYYDFNRVSISKGGSYIESPKCLKNKKSTANQKNNDYKCFQYATTLALNFNKIDKKPPKEYQELNHLLRITTGMILIFLPPKKIGIGLKLIIKMLLLIFYMFLLILKKLKSPINLNII